jgi:hypothetical protein
MRSMNENLVFSALDGFHGDIEQIGTMENETENISQMPFYTQICKR